MARRRNEPSGPTFYTTFQVARLLGVSPPTVVNWVNSGLLQAHKTPGGHRRIRQEELVAFARAQDYPIPAALTEAEAPPTNGPRRVLVVDDNPDFCLMVKEYLELEAGFEVETAHSGFAAGLTIGRFHPGVILMDIRMPEMDGFEAVHHLREDPDMRAVPVIACTGQSDPEVERRVQQEGFAGYLLKPVRLEQLLAVVEQAITKARPSS